MLRCLRLPNPMLSSPNCTLSNCKACSGCSTRRVLSFLTKEGKNVVQLWRPHTNVPDVYTNVATSFSVKNPSLASGGILADDMGLGKNIQTYFPHCRRSRTRSRCQRCNRGYAHTCACFCNEQLEYTDGASHQAGTRPPCHVLAWTEKGTHHAQVN